MNVLVRLAMLSTASVANTTFPRHLFAAIVIVPRFSYPRLHAKGTKFILVGLLQRLRLLGSSRIVALNDIPDVLVLQFPIDHFRVSSNSKSKAFVKSVIGTYM